MLQRLISSFQKKKKPALKLPHGVTYERMSLLNIFERNGCAGPICHVGSLLNTDGTEEKAVRMRQQPPFAGKEFIGIDLFPGPNVDLVADLCDADFIEKNPKLLGYFGFVYSSALLEHVANPFAVAANIDKMLKPGGHLYVTGPWVWGYHPYPDDYWRISFSGLKALFPRLEWKDWWYSGTVKDMVMRFPQRIERKVFQRDATSISAAAAIITDRSMPYLNIGAIGMARADFIAATDH